MTGGVHSDLESNFGFSLAVHVGVTFHFNTGITKTKTANLAQISWLSNDQDSTLVARVVHISVCKY